MPILVLKHGHNKQACQNESVIQLNNPTSSNRTLGSCHCNTESEIPVSASL